MIVTRSCNPCLALRHRIAERGLIIHQDANIALPRLGTACSAVYVSVKRFIKRKREWRFINLGETGFRIIFPIDRFEWERDKKRQKTTLLQACFPIIAMQFDSSRCKTACVRLRFFVFRDAAHRVSHSGHDRGDRNEQPE